VGVWGVLGAGIWGLWGVVEIWARGLVGEGAHRGGGWQARREGARGWFSDACCPMRDVA
jgi:hypothetical protein